MARSKKNTASSFGPSLFDGFDTGITIDEPPILPGLERHIQAAVTSRRNSAVPQPLDDIKPVDKVIFISLGSGSSGNCAYLGNRHEGILIDAGVDNKRVESELSRLGIPMSAIRGILLTHDHGDHIRYAYSLLRRRQDIALLCTPRALGGLLRRHSISRRIKDYHRPIYKEIPFTVAGFEVTAFEVDHDGTDNAGFHITRGTLALTIATDLGHIGERADFYLRRATCIVLESNYDLDMLRRGSYPEYLKARIMAGNGHMDNADTARYLAEIYTPSLTHVFLCHLSHDNNTPEIALATVRASLVARGITPGDGSNSPQAQAAPLQLQALPRFESSDPVTFRL